MLVSVHVHASMATVIYRLATTINNIEAYGLTIRRITNIIWLWYLIAIIISECFIFLMYYQVKQLLHYWLFDILNMADSLQTVP